MEEDKYIEDFVKAVEEVMEDEDNTNIQEAEKALTASQVKQIVKQEILKFIRGVAAGKYPFPGVYPYPGSYPFPGVYPYPGKYPYPEAKSETTTEEQPTNDDTMTQIAKSLEEIKKGIDALREAPQTDDKDDNTPIMKRITKSVVRPDGTIEREVEE